MLNEDIQNPLPLRDRGYSLDSDMIFGWKPGFKRYVPIALTYKAISMKPSVPLLYKGYRAHNSYAIHAGLQANSADSYSFNEEDTMVPPYALMSAEKGVPQKSMGMTQEDTLIFDSKFECGNLDRVYQVSETEFDLYMRSDTNTKSYLHWFYFSIENVPKGTTLRLNIVNFSRASPLYNNGMKPRVFSLKSRCSWQEAGGNLVFGLSKLNSCYGYLKRPFYCLSFDYTFVHKDDKVWFATSIPYPLSKLQRFLGTLKTDTEKSVLCKSICLIDIPLLTITSPKVPDWKKKTVVVVGRIHPAESVSSYTTEGFLTFLTSPEGATLRKKYIFKVVPMLNVDGVVAGNSRTCVCGNDLNRKYAKPSEDKHPGVHALKALMESEDIFMFLDLHGHFCKKGTFFYGPYFPVHHSNYYKTRVISKLFSELSEMFRYYSCRYKEERKKWGAGRMVAIREFGVTYAYTLETSYYGYFDANRGSHAFSIEDLLLIGKNLGKSFKAFDLLIQQQKANRPSKLKMKRDDRRLDDVINLIKSEEQKENPDSESEESDSDEEENEETKEVISEESSSEEETRLKRKKNEVKTYAGKYHAVRRETSNKIQLPAVKGLPPAFNHLRLSTKKPIPISPRLNYNYLPSHYTTNSEQTNPPNEKLRIPRPIDHCIYKTENQHTIQKDARSRSTIPGLFASSMLLKKRLPEELPQIDVETPYIPQMYKEAPKRNIYIPTQRTPKFIKI